MSRRYRASSARCSCSCCCSRVRHGARIRKGRARRIAADQASSNLRRGTHVSAHFASYWCRISARRQACARIHSGERYARTARLTGSNSRELDRCITCARCDRRARRLPAGTGPGRRQRPLVLSHRSCDQPQVLVPLAIRSGSSAGSRRSARPANRQSATHAAASKSSTHSAAGKSANKHVASRLTEAERSTLFHEFLLWKERQKP